MNQPLTVNGHSHARAARPDQKSDRHQIAVTVNGARHQVAVDARTSLLDFLRDGLGLTGAKAGCDTGQCGACTVALDGASVKACMVLAVQAHGSEVATIEGFAQHGQMTPLQEAFQEVHAVQCGFCTPGMVIAMWDLLEHNPDPSESEIRAGLDGVLCRCTGYHNVVKAVQSAAATMRG